jgi:hypothetical protein
VSDLVFLVDSREATQSAESGIPTRSVGTIRLAGGSSYAKKGPHFWEPFLFEAMLAGIN